MHGAITITRGNGVDIHTYTAPAEAFEVTTHLVELPTQLVAIDGQFGLPHAMEVVGYAASLNKPISRLYITHAHPDHYFGAAKFGAPIYALPEVREAINATGDEMAARNRAQLGDFVPDTVAKPDHLATPGEDTIEGIRLELRRIEGIESASQLTIAIPEADAIIVQDLVYNGVHTFIAEQRCTTWKTALAEYEQLPYTRVLPGHGPAGGKELYGQVAQYLDFAELALARARSGEELIALLTERFPDYRGAPLLEIQNHYLFPAAVEASHAGQP